MGWIFKRKKEALTQQELVEVENILQSSLYSATPRQQYIQKLRQEILAYELARKSTNATLEYLVIILACLAMVAFVLSLIVRVVGGMIGIYGVVQYLRRDSERKRIKAPA